MPENSSPNSNKSYKKKSNNTGGVSPKPKLKQPKPKPKPAAPKKQSFADKLSSGIKSLGSKFKESLNKPANPAVMKAHQEFMKQTSKDDKPSGIVSLKNTNTTGAATGDMADQYAENMRRYNEYMQSQQPQQPTVTPEMRREALNIFESQQGAGQMPYYMAAARGGPNASPAFNYAARNYGTLGGAQRIAPRPMEMMSVAERKRINDMAQGMADQQAAENDYQAGMDMVLRGGGKGGPRTGPQLPPGMVGLPRDPMMPRFGGKGGGGVAPQMPPNYGGGMPRPPLPFASILASRFGGFGG